MIERPDLHALAPEPDADSSWFWEALTRDELLVPECRCCGRRFFPPLPCCPYCASTDVVPAHASGRGDVYSWVTIHVALDPAFADDVPYTILAVDLEGGGRMMGRLLDGVGADVHAGAPVLLTPYRVSELVLPGFQLNETTKETHA
jgi:hypothetical protein